MSVTWANHKCLLAFNSKGDESYLDDSIKIAEWLARATKSDFLEKHLEYYPELNDYHYSATLNKDIGCYTFHITGEK